MKIYITILVALLLVGCQGKEAKQVVFGGDVENKSVESKIAKNENLEIVNQFSMNNISWNDGLSLMLDYDSLKRQFPSIRTIKKPEIYDMLNCDSIAYINNTEFEKCGPNKCRLLSIEFDETINRLSIGQKTISQNTTLSELAKMFNECETMRKLKIHGDTTSYNTCLIMSGYQDFGLHVFSTKGKIMRVDIWEPS